jgi:internalin A
MQPRYSTWRRTVAAMGALVIMAAGGHPGFTAEPPAQKAPPKPLPKEIVEAWKEAGADVGWMRADKFGLLKLLLKKEGLDGDLPAFGFSAWKDGLLPKLPAPAAAFGLNLFGCKVRDVGLKDLAGLKNLRALNLRFNQVSDAGLKELAPLKNLQTLNLGFTYVSDAGLKELAALKNLEALELFRTLVTAAGLKELAELKKLQKLDLGGTRVTDAGLQQLAGLKSLRALNLNSTQVTNAGLKELAGLKKLQTLDLRGTQVTDAGLKELQKTLPDCKISLSVKPLDLEIPPPPKKDSKSRNNHAGMPGLDHYM